jgi:hypothetical protein
MADASSAISFGEMGQESWNMAATQMMQMSEMKQARAKYEDEKAAYGAEFAFNQLMKRSELSLAQKKMIIEAAGAQIEMAGAQTQNVGSAFSLRNAIEDKTKMTRVHAALARGIMSGIASKGGTSVTRKQTGAMQGIKTQQQAPTSNVFSQVQGG